MVSSRIRPSECASCERHHESVCVINESVITNNVITDDRRRRRRQISFAEFAAGARDLLARPGPEQAAPPPTSTIPPHHPPNPFPLPTPPGAYTLHPGLRLLD